MTVIPRLRISEHGAVGSDDDARNAIKRDAVQTCWKDVGLFNQGFVGLQRGQRREQERVDKEKYGGHGYFKAGGTYFVGMRRVVG